MPILGVGIAPGNPAGGELQSFTRRAFIPEQIVLTRNATPLTAALFASAKPAGGGLSSITVPWQAGNYVVSQWTDASGKFTQPQALNPGINGEWNLKVLVTPIPMYFGESLV